MNLNVLADITLAMDGKMPESSRYLLAMKILEAIGLHLQEKDATLLREWQDSKAPANFLAACQLKSGPPWVNHEIAVHNTDMATLINRWMNVERIRRKKDGKWEPLTADQNDIRCAIVEDLKALHKAQSEV